jgi:hypothetical protein
MTKLKLSPAQRFSPAKFTAFAATTVALGIIVILVTLAAGAATLFEPENGTLTGGAKVITVAGASGGRAVQFSANPIATPTPTATPTPSPGGGGTCAPYPSFPDTSCTGPTGTLTTYTGSTDFRTAGQVIQNVLINASQLTIYANNVTFRNCKIVYNGALDAGFTLIYIPSGVTGVTFDHCEIDGQNKIARAIEGVDGVIVRNCNIHHTGNGIEVGTNITATDNYIHDIFTPSGLDWHADGIQAADSASNITIDHNVILLTEGETGAINIVSNGGVGTFSNVLIQHNLMAGGGYTVYAGSSQAKTINFKVINNHFSTRYFPKVGYWNIWYPTYLSGVTISGNVIDETGSSADDNSF